jgi:hypothetical protein
MLHGRDGALLLALAAIAAVLPIVLFAYFAVGVRVRPRYSLFNVLIAMTLVAAVLGLIVALR